MKTRQDQIKFLNNLKDINLDYSDIPEVSNFNNWQPNPFFKPIKAQLSAKIDKDILAWLKTHGAVSKYINQLLREKMFEERHKK